MFVVWKKKWNNYTRHLFMSREYWSVRFYVFIRTVEKEFATKTVEGLKILYSKEGWQVPHLILQRVFMAVPVANVHAIRRMWWKNLSMRFDRRISTAVMCFKNFQDGWRFEFAFRFLFKFRLSMWIFIPGKFFIFENCYFTIQINFFFVLHSKPVHIRYFLKVFTRLYYVEIREH